MYGYFLNGGGQAYVVRIGGTDLAPAAAPKARGELLSGSDGNRPGYIATAITDGTAPITVEVTDPPEGSPDETFRVVVRSGEHEEVYEPVTTKRGRTNLVTTINQQSTLIRLEEAATGLGDVARRPGNATVTLARPEPAQVVPRPNDYVGSAADRTGFGGLEADRRRSPCCAFRT